MNVRIFVRNEMTDSELWKNVTFGQPIEGRLAGNVRGTQPHNNSCYQFVGREKKARLGFEPGSFLILYIWAELPSWLVGGIINSN